MTTKNSTLVANFEATPPVANDASNLHGVVRVASGSVELAIADVDTVGAIVMFAPIPSNATVLRVAVGSDSFGGSCAFDVGIYDTSGAVKDADAFGSAVLDGAGMADVRTEAANIDTIGNKMYELAGDSEDEGGHYYVGATFTVVGTTAGTMSFIIEYAVN